MCGCRWVGYGGGGGGTGRGMMPEGKGCVVVSLSYFQLQAGCMRSTSSSLRVVVSDIPDMDNVLLWR